MAGSGLLTDKMNSIVMRLDIDGTILSMNPYSGRFFGVEPAVCAGRKISACIGADGNTADRVFTSILSRVIKDPDGFLTSFGEITAAGGIPVWITWTHSALHNDKGGIEEVILVGNEMTAYKHLEYDLKDTNDRFKVMLENIQTGVIIIDPSESIILYANNVASGIFGIPRDQIVGEPCKTFCSSGGTLCSIDPAETDAPMGRNLETSYMRTDGKQIHLIRNLSKVNFRGTDFILESFIDITQKKQAEERLVNASNQIENLLSSIVSVLIGVAINDNITHWNKVAEDLFNIRAENVLNTTFPNCGINWEWNRIYEGIADSILLEKIVHLSNIEFIGNEGKTGYLDMTINAIMDQKKEVTGFLLFGEDVTEKELNKALLEEIENRKKVQQELIRLNSELERLAKEDPLTGLPNRRFFMDQFEKEYLRAERYGFELALMILDVDHFKMINDTHGHQVGDKVLIALAEAIRNSLRSSDMAGRYGGEEFCIFLPQTDGQQAAAVAEKLRNAVSKLQFSGETDFSMTCSIGVTVLHPGKDDITSIIRRADEALYEAKETGRNRVSLHC
jgi:diguanylate cyclase (GGDEF)-like protein/PAS domain S-box-containing protein